MQRGSAKTPLASPRKLRRQRGHDLFVRFTPPPSIYANAALSIGGAPVSNVQHTPAAFVAAFERISVTQWTVATSVASADGKCSYKLVTGISNGVGFTPAAVGGDPDGLNLVFAEWRADGSLVSLAKAYADQVQRHLDVWLSGLGTKRSVGSELVL